MRPTNFQLMYFYWANLKPLWSKSCNEFVKLNVNAALMKESTFLVIVVCVDKGEIMKTWNQEAPITEPIIAEAATILQALGSRTDKDREIAKDHSGMVR